MRFAYVTEVKNNLLNYLSFSVASSFKFGNDLLYVSGCKFCNRPVDFEDLFSNLLALSIDFILAFRSLVRWWRKLLISSLFHENPRQSDDTFSVSRLISLENGERRAICIKLSVCWIATSPNAFVCVQLQKKILCIIMHSSRDELNDLDRCLIRSFPSGDGWLLVQFSFNTLGITVSFRD